MKLKPFILVVAAACLTLAGCSGLREGPSEAELASRRQAENIYPYSFRDDVVHFMRTYLNDPTGIRNASISPAQKKTVAGIERYASCVRFDAKKSDGRYAGTKETVAVFVSGRLDRLIEARETGEAGEEPGGAARQIRELCKDAAYTPFPELHRLTR